MIDDPVNGGPEPGGIDLTVVVPASNSAATLGQQLDALVNQVWRGRFEVVVVDNCSTDGTAALVERYAARHQHVRLVPAMDRRGIGYARNAGIAAARSERILMCDSDDEVAPGWVAALGDALEEHDFVTGPLDVRSLNEEWVRATRGFAIEDRPGRFLDLFDFAHSCNVGFHRSRARAVGGFAEDMGNGSDVEFSFRMWRSGAVLHFVHAARVAYRYRDDLGGLWRQSRGYARAKWDIARRVHAAGIDVRVPSSRRTWLWLLRNLGLLRHRAGRARWVWTAGGAYGSLEGWRRFG